MYYLSQFHQIRHTESEFLKKSNNSLEERKVFWSRKLFVHHLKLGCQIRTLKG